VRVLLYLGAAITVVTTIAAISVLGPSSEVVGALVWASWPGVVAFVIARGLPRGGRRLFWWTVAVCAFWVLGALAALGEADPRGFVQLLLPGAIVILLIRPASRAFLR
jgi:hypothetical protein